MKASAAEESRPRRSVRLNNYNNWWFEGDGLVGNLAKLQIVAKRDNICFTESWPIKPAAVKLINADAKVYRVHTLCCKSNWETDRKDPKNTGYMLNPVTKAMIDEHDWWLRDGNGNIVKEHENTWFLDVGKPGFKEAFLRSLLSRMDGKDFDGVVFDYWWPGIVSRWITGAKHPAPACYPDDEVWFREAWVPFINHVTGGLRSAGYRIIGNCAGEYGTRDLKLIWQRSKLDGTIYEQWALGWPRNGGGWLPGGVIERRIKAMYSDPLEVWTADLGLQSKDPDYGRKHLVGLAMYYVAIPPSQTNRSYGHFGNMRVFWEKLWDFYIGEPSAPAVKMPGKYFWSRRFSEGLVLLNYEAAASIKYSLDGKYRDPEGKKVSGEVVIPSHTGMILALDGSSSTP